MSKKRPDIAFAKKAGSVKFRPEVIQKEMSEYKIVLKTTVDGETTELLSYGDIRSEAGSTVVEFEEPDAGEITKIVLGGGIVSVVRDGKINSVMQFEKGKSFSADLATEWGSFAFPYTVERAFSHVGESGVRVILSYTSGTEEEAVRYEVDVKCEKVTRSYEI